MSDWRVGGATKDKQSITADWTRTPSELIDGVRVIDPAEGEMACGEFGPGRLPEPEAIMEWLSANGLLGAA